MGLSCGACTAASSPLHHRPVLGGFLQCLCCQFPATDQSVLTPVPSVARPDRYLHVVVSRLPRSPSAVARYNQQQVPPNTTLPRRPLTPHASLPTRSYQHYNACTVADGGQSQHAPAPAAAPRRPRIQVSFNHLASPNQPFTPRSHPLRSLSRADLPFPPSPGGHEYSAAILTADPAAHPTTAARHGAPGAAHPHHQSSSSSASSHPSYAMLYSYFDPSEPSHEVPYPTHAHGIPDTHTLTHLHHPVSSHPCRPPCM